MNAIMELNVDELSTKRQKIDEVSLITYICKYMQSYDNENKYFQSIQTLFGKIPNILYKFYCDTVKKIETVNEQSINKLAEVENEKINMLKSFKNHNDLKYIDVVNFFRSVDVNIRIVNIQGQTIQQNAQATLDDALKARDSIINWDSYNSNIDKFFAENHHHPKIQLLDNKLETLKKPLHVKYFKLLDSPFINFNEELGVLVVDLSNNKFEPNQFIKINTGMIFGHKSDDAVLYVEHAEIIDDVLVFSTVIDREDTSPYHLRLFTRTGTVGVIKVAFYAFKSKDIAVKLNGSSELAKSKGSRQSISNFLTITDGFNYMKQVDYNVTDPQHEIPKFTLKTDGKDGSLEISGAPAIIVPRRRVIDNKSLNSSGIIVGKSSKLPFMVKGENTSKVYSIVGLRKRLTVKFSRGNEELKSLKSSKLFISGYYSHFKDYKIISAKIRSYNKFACIRDQIDKFIEKSIKADKLKPAGVKTFKRLCYIAKDIKDDATYIQFANSNNNATENEIHAVLNGDFKTKLTLDKKIEQLQKIINLEISDDIKALNLDAETEIYYTKTKALVDSIINTFNNSTLTIDKVIRNKLDQTFEV